MRYLADVCYLVAAVLYLPVLCYQMLIQKKNRRGWGQRLGRIQPRVSEQPCIWIHAVSLGEVNATRVLIQQLRQALPHVDLVISTTTDTGYARARALYADLNVFRYPLDFSWVVTRVLRRIRPTVIVLMELEVWYNLITLAARRGVTIAVANGRFTARSASRFRWIRALSRPMFAALSWVGAQNARIGQRFREAGVPDERVEVLSSVKWDTAQLAERIDGQDELAAAMGIRRDQPLIVLGSSGPGEELAVIAAWQAMRPDHPHLQLAVVPRKPERFDDVARQIREQGLSCVRRSERPDGMRAEAAAEAGLLLGDSMGELRKFYSLADIVIVGRTLVPLGGSDLMEVAALGKPIVVGTHTENFADAKELLQAAGALQVVPASTQLPGTLSRLLANEPQRHQMGACAREVVLQNQGATRRTVEVLVNLLPTRR